MIDECTEFIFIQAMFINTIQRYFVPVKYKRLNFLPSQEKSLPILRLSNSFSIHEPFVFE